MDSGMSMDKWQALQAFWDSFGIDAYDESSVPDDAVPPYITYRAGIDEFESSMMLYASVWYRSSSWKDISLKTSEIEQAIGAFKLIPLNENEYLYIKKGTPFAQRMRDEDETIKRVYINIEVEYFTQI
jgi:hypothetical protein